MSVNYLLGPHVLVRESARDGNVSTGMPHEIILRHLNADICFLTEVLRAKQNKV